MHNKLEFTAANVNNECLKPQFVLKSQDTRVTTSSESKFNFFSILN